MSFSVKRKILKIKIFTMVNCSKLSLSSIHSRFLTFKTSDCKFKLFIALLICTIISLIYLYGYDFGNVASKLTPRLRLSQKEIIILQWTPYWGTTYPTTVLDSDKCSMLKTGFTQQPSTSRVYDKPYLLTYDHKYLYTSDAVVFRAADLNYGRPPSGDLLETRRALNQIWVWHQREALLQYGVPKDIKAYQNVFNWTMTYRRDSDVYFPYGFLISNQSTGQDNPSNLVRKSLKMKTGLAAWIVSDCSSSSRREYFVKELQKYIPVDIFGKCGKKCPEPIEHGFYTCYDHIQSMYKFYLSFENSLCQDYITEKFYLALQTDMVPVVYGGGIDDRKMDYLAVAPENSFIDARKFESPQDLANYLLHLDNSDEEYLKYFEWKAKYQVVKDSQGFGWCNLCQRVYDEIHRQNEPYSGKKWYSDLYTWWNYASFLNETAQFTLASQSKAPFSPVGQNFQFDVGKLQPTCVQPKSIFAPYGEYPP